MFMEEEGQIERDSKQGFNCYREVGMRVCGKSE